jgi:hypothetical protein
VRSMPIPAGITPPPPPRAPYSMSSGNYISCKFKRGELRARKPPPPPPFLLLVTCYMVIMTPMIPWHMVLVHLRLASASASCALRAARVGRSSSAAPSGTHIPNTGYIALHITAGCMPAARKEAI